MRLVAHKTKHLRGKVRDIEDVLSEGMVGLIKAVDHYDPARETPFANFACQCIENEVRMFLRKDQRRRPDVSLDIPLGSDAGDRTILDFLAEGDDLAVEVGRRIQARQARALVDRLSELEREVIELRYGLRGTLPLTQRQVAALNGVSRPYISRIERRALAKLNAWLDQGASAAACETGAPCRSLPPAE
jgi:RNA polymerase sporulation-specific sigma factor